MSWINLKEFQSWLLVFENSTCPNLHTIFMTWDGDFLSSSRAAVRPSSKQYSTADEWKMLLKNVFALPFILLWMCTVRCCLLGLWCVESLTLLRAHIAHYHQTQMCQKKGTNNLLDSVHCDQKTLLRISLFVGEGKSAVVIHSFQL